MKARYQITYCKNQPLTMWMENRQRALDFAVVLRKMGYTASVWEHTEAGSRRVNEDEQ